MSKKRIGLAVVSLVLGYVGFNIFMHFVIGEQFGDDSDSAQVANIILRIYLSSPVFISILGSGLIGYVIMAIIGDMFASDNDSENED